MSKGQDVDDLARAWVDLGEVVDRAAPVDVPDVHVEVPQDAMERPDPATQLRLALDRHDRPRACLANLVLVLRHDPRWASLRTNTIGPTTEYRGRSVSENEITHDTAVFMSTVYGMDFGESTIKGAVSGVAEGRRYSAVAEYLHGLTWDGVERIRAVCPQILGVEDDPIVRAYMKKFFVGAVARALRPGCKLDTALILVGHQGARKSTFFKVLFGEWFSDSPIPIGSKDAFIALTACWGYEAAELENVTKASVEAVKQFLSSPVDSYRGVWARWNAKHPRHSVMCGSTNSEEFLIDETGSRRFWPIKVPGEIDTDTLAVWRDQLWAEAVALFGAGEQWWLTPEEDMLRAARAEQFSADDVWSTEIAAYCVRNAGQWITIADVCGEALKIPTWQQHAGHARRVGAILTRLGWTRRTVPSELRQRFGPKAWRRD